jgi:hypothetical protein
MQVWHHEPRHPATKLRMQHPSKQASVPKIVAPMDFIVERSTVARDAMLFDAEEAKEANIGDKHPRLSSDMSRYAEACKRENRTAFK